MIRRVVTVSLGERSYPIYVGDNILTEFTARFEEMHPSSSAAVITNDTVRGFYGAKLSESLDAGCFVNRTIMVPDSENAKSLEVAEKIYTELLENGFERKDAVVAFGGGVVGDLTGFIAATYQRGIPFVQVPTTLLAQVDSSVGGKVAVNHPLAKNMIGSFYQPSFVYADVETLKTLTERDFASGMAEVIKYALIKGGPLLETLSEKKKKIKVRDVEAMSEIVAMCCIIKADIVGIDERDQGLRAILNYGHTLGHAIESTTEYRYSHGEAVAIGMVFAAKLAENLGMINNKIVDLHERIMKAFELPARGDNLDAEALIKAMERDKKREDGAHRFVLLEGVGNPVVVNVKEKVLRKTLSEFLSEEQNGESTCDSRAES
jgi:3-dehydroquinate synthase